MTLLYCLVYSAVLLSTITVEGADFHLVSCLAGGNFLCSQSCVLHGKIFGGCCGKSGPCLDTCYCKGSGLEYRCDECDLFG